MTLVRLDWFELLIADRVGKERDRQAIADGRTIPELEQVAWERAYT